MNLGGDGPPRPGHPARAWLGALPLAAPVALAALVFARAVGLPFVNWDDPAHFSDNPLAAHPLAHGLRALLLTREIGYPAPLLLLSYALDRALWGLAPGPYHAEDLLLHLTCVALLFRLARRWGVSPWQASAVATLFAVHPLVVEPVCWVTGRKDLLSTALIFGAALVAAGDARDAMGPSCRALSSAGRWGAANALVVLAVLVLPRAVVGAVVVVLLVRGARPAWEIRRTALRMLPALGVALGVVFVGARELTALGGVPPPRPFTGVAADVAAVWALQLGHLLVPVDLLAYYFRVPGDPPAWAMVAAGLVACAALVFAALRLRQGSTAALGVVLALVAYAPVSGVFVIRRWTSDSYMYLPLAAIALAGVPAVARAWPRALASSGPLVAASLAAVLAALSFAGTTRWASSARVWAGSIARYPGEPLSYEHEALGLAADGREAEANALFIQLAERFPDWDDTFDDEVRAYEAAGEPRRAAQVLAHGVQVGSIPCIRMYWMRLLASPLPPPPEQRALVATAFVQGFDAMKAGLHDVAAFRRVVAILQAEGLGDLAAQAADHVRAMER